MLHLAIQHERKVVKVIALLQVYFWAVLLVITVQWKAIARTVSVS